MTRRHPAHRPTIAVVGPGDACAEVEALALEVGRRLGEAGADLVCGGLGGVMAAACEGHARVVDRRALTIGILPTEDRRAANAFVDVAVPTGLGEARNALVARAADAVIAIGGAYGTLSEIALALKRGTPVIGLRTWRLDPPAPLPGGIVHAAEAADAVRLALGQVSPQH